MLDNVIGEENFHIEIERFKKLGYAILRNAFSKETASACRIILDNCLKEDFGINVIDESTWLLRQGIQRVFKKNDGVPWADVFTPKLINSINLICGEGTWEESWGCGWWVVTYPNICYPPWRVDGKWHIDGAWHQHFPYSREVGLVPVMLFSDIFPEGGGTAVLNGSHKYIARLLVEGSFQGCSSAMVASCMTADGIDIDRVMEITGQAGDVFFMHPLLLHARSTNLGTLGVASIRYMCHPTIVLKDHMRFDPPRSVLEQSIVEAVAEVDDDSQKLMTKLLSITPESVAQFHADKNRNKRSREEEDSDIEADEAMLSLMGFSQFS